MGVWGIGTGTLSTPGEEGKEGPPGGVKRRIFAPPRTPASARASRRRPTPEGPKPRIHPARPILMES